MDAAQKYYLKTVELLREVANIEYNQTRKFVLLSLSRAFEELSRGRPSKKSAQFAPPASQNSASSSAAVIGEMGLNEVPTISATAVATAAKMKAVDKQNVILETQLTQAVTFLEIAGEISAVHVTQKRERRERERDGPLSCSSFRNCLGHEQAKKVFLEAVILPQRFPQLFTGMTLFLKRNSTDF